MSLNPVTLKHLLGNLVTLKRLLWSLDADQCSVEAILNVVITNMLDCEVVQVSILPQGVMHTSNNHTHSQTYLCHRWTSLLALRGGGPPPQHFGGMGQVRTASGGGTAGPLRIDLDGRYGAKPMQPYSEAEAQSAFVRMEAHHRQHGWAGPQDGGLGGVGASSKRSSAPKASGRSKGRAKAAGTTSAAGSAAAVGAAGAGAEQAGGTTTLPSGPALAVSPGAGPMGSPPARRLRMKYVGVPISPDAGPSTAAGMSLGWVSVSDVDPFDGMLLGICPCQMR